MYDMTWESSRVAEKEVSPNISRIIYIRSWKGWSDLLWRGRVSNFQALSSWFSQVDFYLWWLFNWTGRAVSPYGRRWARWPFLFPAELISTHLKSLVNISPLDSQQIGHPPLPLVRIRHSLACPAHAKWCGSDDDQGKSRIRLRWPQKDI